MSMQPLEKALSHRFERMIKGAIGVSDDTVYKWINSYDMPAHRLGHLWKFKKAEVDAWVKSGRSVGR